MRITDIFIKRPVLSIVVSLLILLIGLRAAMVLPIRQYPKLSNTVVNITTSYPGASPDTVEREIVNRLEKPLLAISGATKIESAANEGSAQIFIEFSFKKNLIEASDEIRNEPRAV